MTATDHSPISIRRNPARLAGLSVYAEELALLAEDLRGHVEVDPESWQALDTEKAIRKALANAREAVGP